MSAARSLAGLPAGRRSKYLVLLLWLAVVAIAGPLGGKLASVQQNALANWLPGSAEAPQVFDQAARFQSKNVVPAVVLYERPSGLTDADRAKVAADVGRLSALPGAGRVIGPVTAKDGQALQVTVPVDLGSNGWSQAGSAVDRIRAITDADRGGLSTAVTGPLGFAADSTNAFSGIDGALLAGTVLVVILLLLITYRSPILWLLPVFSAGIALTTAQAVVYLLAKHAGLTVNGQSAGILTVLVFGAGTDYALLLIARYREELRRHEDRHQAMREALRRCGPAIIASAGTVAVGMLTLVIAQMNSTRSLGPVLAIGVTVGLLTMITLLPALLVICGRWLFWPVRPKAGSTETVTRGLWARAGTSIARRPRLVWVAATVVLGVLALGTTTLHAGGLTNAQTFTGEPASVTGEQALARHFPAGTGSPVVVIGAAAEAAEIRTALAGVPGITAVTEPVTNGDLAYLQGTLAAPADSNAAYDVVDRAREAVHAVPGAAAKVGGDSATSLAINRASTHDRRVIIPVLLLVVFLILTLVLRAVLAPLLLIATVVLSFGAALGISALAFEHVFGWSASDTSFPLFVFVFLVALGIDYNIFLMTRVREEAQQHGTRKGSLIGLAATGGVITSAGIVLAGTFAALGSLPLVAFVEIGFAVAFGVLLDTLVVRSVLVTALNLDLGRAMWWPSKLSRPVVEQSEEQAGRHRREELVS